MKPSEINTALRTIHLEHRTKGRLSKFEKEALKEYENLHNRLYTLVKRHTAMNGKMLERETELNNLQMEMHALDNRLKHTGSLTGHNLEDFIVYDGTNVTIDFNQILTISRKLNSHMKIYSEAISLSEKEMDIWYNDCDIFCKDTTQYIEKYINIIVNDWENMVLDEKSLEKDLQEYYSEIDDLCRIKRNSFIDNWNLFFEKNENFYQKLNDLIHRINTHFKPVDKMLNSVDIDYINLN